MSATSVTDVIIDWFSLLSSIKNLLARGVLQRHRLSLFLALSLLLFSGFFSRDKNTFPRFKKGIIDKRGKSEIAKLEKASSDVSSRGDEPANSEGNGKGLYHNR